MNETKKRKVELMGFCDLCGQGAGQQILYRHGNQKLCEDHLFDDGLRRNAPMNKTGKSDYKQKLIGAFQTLIPRNRCNNNAPDSNTCGGKN